MASDRLLVLVKHAWPRIDRARPARSWPLSDRGRAQAAALAEELRALAPRRVVASREPKAADTGRLLAQAWRCPFALAEGLHEHDREGVGYLPEDAFRAAVARFFAEPERRVLGRESAREAATRFAAAVDAVLDGGGPSREALGARGVAGAPTHAADAAAGTHEDAPDVTVVVAHGTVISLFLADRCGVDGFATWSVLALPAYAAVAAPPGGPMRLVRLVGRPAAADAA